MSELDIILVVRVIIEKGVLPGPLFVPIDF